MEVEECVSLEKDKVTKGTNLPDYVIQERIDLQKEIYNLRQEVPQRIIDRVIEMTKYAQKLEKTNGDLQSMELKKSIESQLAKTRQKRPVEQFPKTVTFEEFTSTPAEPNFDSSITLTARLSNGPVVLKKKFQNNAFAQLDMFHQHILRTFPEHLRRKVDQ